MIHKMTLEEIYLDWINNFLSTEKFAEHYELEIKDAHKLIDVCIEIYKSK